MKAFVRVFVLGLLMVCAGAGQTIEDTRQQRDKLVERGLWKDALAFYRTKLMPVSDAGSGDDLDKAVKSINRLGNWADFDELVESAVAGHQENPHLLWSASYAYEQADRNGRLVGGEFQRGNSNGEGDWLDTSWRDSIRGLQLLTQALKHAQDDPLKVTIWESVASRLETEEGWRFQILTPLAELPEWTEPGPQGGTEGAPWRKDGPVLFGIPASWEAAKNDGERWRFALAEVARLDPKLAGETIISRARFSLSQFGLETLDYDARSTEGKLSPETLAEDEVLAKTSDGVRRFKLPAEHHFIALLRSVLDSPEAGESAGDMLVQVYLERDQRVKAREVLEQVIAKHGNGPEDSRKVLLRQITGNWGMFSLAETVSAGTKPKLPLTFRNGTKVGFTAAPVDMDAVLADTIAYLKGNPRDLDWQRVNPSAVASRIINQSKPKYVGEVAARWDAPLEPPAEHREGRAEIVMPIDKAGAWWVTAKMENGNEFHTLVWIVDNLIVQREVEDSRQWWSADAATGAPIEGVKIEFFGYRTVGRNRKTPLERRMDVLTKSLERTTDADGRTLLKQPDLDREYQWMAVARKEGRATAFFGFQPYAIAVPEFQNGNRDISYGITDRPLYKPGDPLHVKFYLRNVGYFEPDEAKYANRTGTLVLMNGRGEEALKVSDLRTDELGAVEADVTIPKDAPLGRWQATFLIQDVISAGVSFQVEEFRKPEYEVTVEAPREPIKLGDKFTALVKATYFHGAPVREAEVEITVKRSTLHDRWFPMGRWDWLYGKGAWWPGVSLDWHPGFRSWSCMPDISGPRGPWGGRRWTPDEVVLERKMKIGPDGTAKVEIDTAKALEIHSDIDSEYSIEARVVDASRREETGNGSVIAARKPFEIVVWADRGFARPGEELQTFISAATLAGKTVAGAEGTLKLYRLSVEGDGRIGEKETGSWPVTTDAEGKASVKFPAPEAGQYRLAARLVLKGGESSESASVLNVHGEGKAEAKDWKFGAIELITDKLEYAAGDTLKLRVNSDQPDAHVWLFLHVGGSSSREAKRIQLDGKSLEVPVPLDRRDMPNMFVEAVTVFGARIHNAYREVLLPPEKKMIEVAVEPAKAKVGPGEKSSLKILLKDSDGKPLAGKAVVSVYDKALEAITGGSNVQPIHMQFWDWKNYYYSGRSSCSLPSSPGNLVKEGSPEMETWGISGVRRGVFFGMGMRTRSVSSMADPFADSSASAPAAAAAPAPAAEMAMKDGGGGGSPGPQPVQVRKDFADLLKWVGTVVTDGEGRAEIPLEFPDNLTTWKVRVWVLGSGTRVGEGSAEIVTSKELLVRLQAPRFLVERDESVLSAIVHNDHEVEKTVKVSLETEGDVLKLIKGETKTVTIAARSEARVDWRVKALHEGTAKIRMKAEADDGGDAMERELPVRVHGMMRQDAWSRVIDPEAASAKIAIEVPEKLRPEDTRLTVRYSPSVALSVVDAIPYLADYPYGCTEQTLNRFVPAVIAQRLLKDMNINLADVKAKRANLNAQQLGDAKARAEEWRQWQRNPVFDEEELRKMVKAGMDKLVSMQNSDGGWGWFSGFGEQSYPHTTAVVAGGLLAAKAAGTTFDEGMLKRGVEWLQGYERKQIAELKRHDDREAAIKAGKKPKPSKLPEKSKADSLDALIREILGRAGVNDSAMTDYLFRDRIDLPAYAQALLGLELHRLKDAARRDEVMALLSQFVKRDEENQTAYLDLKNEGYWWNWYGSGIEANAWYLKLLTAVKPQDADTRGLVKYLVNNRRGGCYWNSTRDTAYAIEAIAGYAKATGEATPEMEVEVLVDGKSHGKIAINADNLFTFDGTVSMAGRDVAPGKHEIEIRRSGKGAVYANAYLEVFTLEDRLRAAGLEVKVQRTMWKITTTQKESEVPDDTGLLVTQTEERVKREPLEDGAEVSSGDRIEVELIIESKNDYEYLLFSDAKAAGFEALDALSGYQYGSGLSAYMEPRDRTVDFFIRSLPRGTHTLKYQLRAEAPGTFKALPAVASAMYAPELRGNSADFRIGIRE